MLAREKKKVGAHRLPIDGGTGFGSYGINALPAGTAAFWFIDPLKPARLTTARRGRLIDPAKSDPL